MDSDIDPTHVLVITDDETVEEVSAANAAIDAALDHADTVDLWLDEEQLESDHPELYEQIRNAFDRMSDGHLRGAVAGDSVRMSLSELLDDTSFHRFISLERLEASHNGDIFLSYVPDHRLFDVDASVQPDVEAAIRGAIETEQAALLPSEAFVDWYAEGRHYELSPTHLCVDDRECYDLTNIEAVHFDDLTMQIEWTGGSGTISKILTSLGPDRPTTLQFEHQNRYEDVVHAFQRLGEQLGWSIED